MLIKKTYTNYQKTYGSIKGLCFLAYWFIHIVGEFVYALIIKTFIPVNKSVIVFRSIPDYADNARALADYMVENDYTKKYRIYFDVKDVEKFRNRDGLIKFISTKSSFGFHKLSCLRLLLTAKYLMCTHEMIIFKRFFYRKEQSHIRLWHGCGYKDNYQKTAYPRMFDLALVPGELFVKAKAHFWNVDEKYILPIGYPRFDWLRCVDITAQQLIESFKKNSNTKVVLWMPTFRVDNTGRYSQSNSITQFPIVGNEIKKWKELDSLCIKNNIVLLVKLHPYQKEYDIPFDIFSNISEINNQFFERVDLPQYKFIALTNALISDYSSVAVDYLVVNRPIAFTLDDYDEYKNTRGFVFEDPRAYMPGHHLYTFNDLEQFLLDVSYDKDPYKSKREQMYGKAICYSDNYCRSVLDTLGIIK